MGRDAEIREKEKRVRELIQSKGVAGVLLKRQANFSWMTGGGLNLVGITTELGATSLLITKHEKYVISNNIEAPRMIHEEGLEAQGFIVKTYPWYEEEEASIVKGLVKEGIIGADVPFPDAAALSEDIAQLRYSLTPEEIERGKSVTGLGKNVARDATRRKGIRSGRQTLPGALEGPH
jgi:hypothetical protein